MTTGMYIPPQRNFDGSPLRQAALSNIGNPNGHLAELRAKAAFDRCAAKLGGERVVGIMQRTDSANRFPKWLFLAYAFERLEAAYARGVTGDALASAFANDGAYKAVTQ